MNEVWIKGCLKSPVPIVGGEVWAINSQPKMPFADRWFQLHGLGHILNRHGREYFEWMSEYPGPFYLFERQLHRWPQFVACHGMRGLPLPVEASVFPADTCCNERYGGNYKTNSFDWLMAFAIMRGACIIHLTGIAFSDAGLCKSRRAAAAWIETGNVPKDVLRVLTDLRGEGSGDESWARASLEFYIGLARGYGIDVRIHGKTGLFRNKWGGRYGLDKGGHR